MGAYRAMKINLHIMVKTRSMLDDPLSKAQERASATRLVLVENKGHRHG